MALGGLAQAGAVALVVMLIASGATGQSVVPSNDAASGRDAGATRETAVPIQAGRVYDATGAPWAGDDVDYYAFHAVAGDDVDIAAFGTAGACFGLITPSDSLAANDCDLPTPRTGPRRFPVTLNETGEWLVFVRLLHPGPYRFSVGLNDAPPSPSPLTDAHPPRGDDATCGGLTEDAARTSGAGDPALPSLAWAALKTGYRAVVTWTTETPVVGNVTYALDGGASRIVTEPTPRTLHAFVLDALPVGATLCFRAGSGSTMSAPHALHLANAWNAWDPGMKAYTLNLLVLATEQVASRTLVEDAMHDYASRLADMTDGHLRPGRAIVLHGDLDHHHSGFHSCEAPFLFVPYDAGACHRVVDVAWTHDTLAIANAHTRALGIEDPRALVNMNTLRTTPFFALDTSSTVTIAGRVLAHEMGHYAIGQTDLYGTPTNNVQRTCFDPVTRISVLGTVREARELDGPHAPCENMRGDPSYVPTWTILRKHYPRTPERTSGPVPGPAAPGPAHAVNVLAITPDVPVAVDAQDDAGSGRDAPGPRPLALPVSPGRVLAGTASEDAGDEWDTYTWHVNAGDTLHVRASVAFFTDVTLMDPSGMIRASLDTPALTAAAREREAAVTADVGGSWFLRVNALDPDAYRFSVGVSAPAPALTP